MSTKDRFFSCPRCDALKLAKELADMKIWVGILAVILMIWPAFKIINALYKVSVALLSDTFNLFGKIFIIILVIIGLTVGFPWNLIPAILVFLILSLTKMW